MENIATTIESRMLEAQMIHQAECDLNLRSVDLVGYFERVRAALRLGMSTADFAARIGLTKDVYWKRAAVARSLYFVPKLRALVEQGRLSMSHVAIAAGKLSQANADCVIEMLEGTSVAEARRVMDRIKLDGTVVPEVEATVSVTVTLSAEEFAAWQRAKEVLTHSGQPLSDAQVFNDAVSALLDKRDPLRKAARAEKRRAAATNQRPQSCASESETPPQQKPTPTNAARSPIPAATKQRVWLRDEGRCTFKDASGRRCETKSMIELDHIVMKCRGGDDSMGNLRLLCRYHNQSSAAVALDRVDLRNCSA
jgi:5-methylcytosine-specific restriction endonuclease McrA